MKFLEWLNSLPDVHMIGLEWLESLHGVDVILLLIKVSVAFVLGFMMYRIAEIVEEYFAHRDN